jgi:flagellar assembly factor FliW
LSGEIALQNVSLIPQFETDSQEEELFVIPPHTLYGDYPPKIPENEIKDVDETGEIVLSRVVIPAGVRQSLTQTSHTLRKVKHRHCHRSFLYHDIT